MAVLNREIEFSRRKLGEHLGCDPEELVLCRGGSEAGQIVILGLGLKGGDEVVTTNQDYPRFFGTWNQRQKRDHDLHGHRRDVVRGVALAAQSEDLRPQVKRIRQILAPL